MKSKIEFYSNLNTIALSLYPIVKPYVAAKIVTDIVFGVCAIMFCVLERKRQKKNKDLPIELSLNDILFRFAIMGYGLIICYLCKDREFGRVWLGLVILEIITTIVQLYGNKKLKDKK